jgi:hypothetical protein
MLEERVRPMMEGVDTRGVLGAESTGFKPVFVGVSSCCGGRKEERIPCLRRRCRLGTWRYMVTISICVCIYGEGEGDIKDCTYLASSLLALFPIPPYTARQPYYNASSDQRLLAEQSRLSCGRIGAGSVIADFRRAEPGRAASCRGWWI